MFLNLGLQNLNIIVIVYLYMLCSIIYIMLLFIARLYAY